MNSLKVSTRLSIGFGLVVALLFVLSIVCVNGLSRLYQGLNQVAHFNGREAALASQMRSSLLERAVAVRNVVLFTDNASMQQEADRVAKQAERWRAAADQLAQTFRDDPAASERERAMLAALRSGEEGLTPVMQKAIQLGLANDNATATKVLVDEVRPLQKPLLAQAAELADLEAKQTDDAADRAMSTYSIVRTTIGAVVAFAALMAIACGYVITRSLVRQLGGEPSVAQAITAEIAGGNLAVVVHVGDGNTSSLMGAVAAMRAQLSAVVARIKTATDSIAIAASEIAQGNVDLSARTEEQAASLEETAASMTQLTETVKQNADNARQANTLATRATDVADMGNEAVQGMVGTIGEISESSTKISEITGTIEGIAFQTNILALNAAVEAARAGEQGRGFAVVASEVRSLAQRSAAAAKEIKELIESSVAKIGDGVQQAREVGTTMGEVKQAIKQVSDIVGEIAAASEEQSRGIEQVNQAVSQMDEVTQQNAALVEQSAAAAQSLDEQAKSLAQAVSAFKLSDADVPAARSALAPSRARALPSTASVKRPAVTPSRSSKPPVAAGTPEPAVSATTARQGESWETF
ncbi:MAG TPA: methyl-accepting chemotaxis protein [Trinickia sp.]